MGCKVILRCVCFIWEYGRINPPLPCIWLWRWDTNRVEVQNWHACLKFTVRKRRNSKYSLRIQSISDVGQIEGCLCSHFDVLKDKYMSLLCLNSITLMAYVWILRACHQRTWKRGKVSSLLLLQLANLTFSAIAHPYIHLWALTWWQNSTTISPRCLQKMIRGFLT